MRQFLWSVVFLLGTIISSAQTGVWTNVTPSGISLNKDLHGVDQNYGVQDVLADPARPSDLYAFTCYQGVWKSTNAGVSWTKITASGVMENGRAWGEAIDPNPNRNPATPPTMWACQGYSSATGVYKSTDGGVNWTYIPFPPGDPYCFDVDPYDSNHLIAGLHEAHGVWESTDGGATWHNVTGSGGSGSSQYPFFINTGNAATTRTTWIAIAQANYGGADGTIRTTNGGSTWTKVSSNEHPHGNCQIYQKNGVVYMGGISGPAGNGVYRSTNLGQTWTHVGSGQSSTSILGTPNHIYSTNACAFLIGYDPSFQVGSADGTSWTSVATPSGMTNGPKGAAVTYDASTGKYVIVGGCWLAGIWRYVEDNSSSVPVTSVSVSPTSASIAVNATQQLTATVLPTNATNKNVTWTTSNSTIATISTSGLVTGKAAGSATITVTTADGGKTATCSITVTSGGCTPTTIIPYVQVNGGAWVQTSTASLNAGGTVIFGPQPLTGGWIWSGPNSFSATTREVTIANIQASQAGNYIATYTNTGGCNSTNTFVVTVNGGGNVAVTSVSVSPTSASIAINGTQQLTATVLPTNATNKSVTWTTSNSTIATVSTSGLVTGKAAGAATITVVDGSKTATSALTISTGSGTNLALNKTVTVSSTEGTGLEGSKAVDGNMTTRWASLFSNPQWIYVDLGASYSITRVKLTWEAAYASSYQIQVSANASTWTTIYTTTTGNGATDDLTGLSGTGRYVRMYGTVRATPYGYSLWEFEVYGAALKSASLATAVNPVGSDKIMIYPNPLDKSNLRLNVSGLSAGNFEVVVFDVQGRTVYQNQLKVSGTSVELQLGNMNQGLYIMKVVNINNNQVVLNQKLVVR